MKRKEQYKNRGIKHLLFNWGVESVNPLNEFVSDVEIRAQAM